MYQTLQKEAYKIIKRKMRKFLFMLMLVHKDYTGLLYSKDQWDVSNLVRGENSGKWKVALIQSLHKKKVRWMSKNHRSI